MAEEREPGLVDRSVERRLRRHERVLASMGQPLHREALRALFLSASLLADFLLPAQLWLWAGGLAGAALFGASLGGLLALEWKAYRTLWGPEGKWAPRAELTGDDAG
jgi:hypothetical protein